MSHPGNANYKILLGIFSGFFLLNPLMGMQSLSSRLQPKCLYGVTHEDIDKTYETAPIAIKSWSKELQTRTEKYRKRPYRLYLYGITGVGKTTMALGIMKENLDWERRKINAGEIIRQFRGGAAEELNKAFVEIDDLLAADGKCILIIDSVHVLINSSDNQTHDTNLSAQAIQDFMDVHCDNQNLMIILIGNNSTEMPESINDRLNQNKIEILPPLAEELCALFPYYAYELAYETISMSTLLEAYRVGDVKTGRDVRAFAMRLRDAIVDSGHLDNLKAYSLSTKFLMDHAILHKKNK